jgi:hypothetical protein
MSMTGTRPITAMLVATLGLSVAACSTLNVNDYCQYSQEFSIGQADPESLALVLGIGKERAKETPFVVVRSISEENPGASLRLQAIPAAHPLPASLDESRCARIDWSTYSLRVDGEAWRAFWQDERNSPFEIFIGFLDTNEPLLVSDFGAAILDTTAAEHLVACGCYWR